MIPDDGDGLMTMGNWDQSFALSSFAIELEQGISERPALMLEAGLEISLNGVHLWSRLVLTDPGRCPGLSNDAPSGLPSKSHLESELV